MLFRSRLFINLGKRDGFFPGVLMQTLNRYVGGRQEVGHIDLLDTISYFEVPERDARKVASQLTGIRFKGRTVRCNDSEEGRSERSENQSRQSRRQYPSEPPQRQRHPERPQTRPNKKNDWRSLMAPKPVALKGEEPDFSEEGCARRRPKKR